MSSTEDFFKHIEKGYATKGDFINMGAAMLNGDAVTNAFVKIPLKTLNRHGLIAGATGTGKTKTLQVLAENLSEKGIPVMLMDLKGDLSGIAQPSPGHEKIDARHAKIGFDFEAKSFPVEILSLSEQDGVKLRATISEFGPTLLSRILDLTETQEGIVAVVFKYCDDNKLPLLDLKDFKKVLQYATQEGKKEFAKDYGRISTSSTGTILRKLIELEQQGADLFFGEKSFEVDDLTRIDKKGRGYINILRLTDIQDRPKLFSTFMLSLLAEIYANFPEQGDSDKPELVLFIDEAHLIFKEASKALLDQIESIVKLIRSKGIGLYFVTQNPTDVPNAVLSQLGLKVQHALRAFTARDRKAIKLTAENYPESKYYDTKEVLTALGIGEALISALDEKGRPTPLAATLLRAPMSRMDILTDGELKDVIGSSKLVKKYNDIIDRESAYEMLNEKIEKAEKLATKEKAKEASKKTTRRRRSTRHKYQLLSNQKISLLMKNFSALLLIMGLLLLNCKKEVDTTYLITNDSVGTLDRNSLARDIELIYANDSVVKDTTTLNLGNKAKKLKIYEKGGKLLLTLTPSADSIPKIENIRFEDARFATIEKININSTFKEVQKAYTIKKIITSFNNLLVLVKESDVYFTINKEELPASLRYAPSSNIEAVQIPDDAKIKYMMLGWN